MEIKTGAPMLINPRYNFIKRTKEDCVAQIRSLGLRVSASSQFNSYGNSGYAVVNGIAVVPCSGPMYKGAGSWGYADQSELSAIMNSLTADSSIKGVLKIFDTPGGSVAGTSDYGDSIAACDAVKPCVGYAEDMCCSAGYWAGAQCRKLFCNQSAFVGSIGVISWLTDASKYYEEMGIKEIPITTGKFKTAGDPSQPATPEIVDYMQSSIDDLYSHFVDAVNKGRGISKANIKAMEAAVFVGEKAVSNGLVDGVCSLDDCFNLVSKMASKGGISKTKSELALIDIELAMLDD